MSTFITDTPHDIDEYSEEQIIAMCETFGRSAKPENRARFIKILYTEVFKFDLSKDLLYMLVDQPKEQFVIAPAGGGKTTNIAAKLNNFKLYGKSIYSNSGKIIGDRILSLVYNRGNVKDVKDKNKMFANKINSLGIDGVYVDTNLVCKTFHSFARQMVLGEADFAAMLGITGFKHMDPSKCTEVINNISPVICESLGEELPRGFSAESVLNVNNYMIETFSTLEDLSNTNLVLDTGLSVKAIGGILKAYSRSKARIRKIDHSDSLSLLYRLLTEFPEARERIQKFYDVVTADEIQDTTSILMNIIKLIVGPHASLICIGDDDQAIYGFRGADNKNALNFKELFPESKVHLLRTNRRCPSNHLNLADNVISLNTSRFAKEMRAVKGPGNIEFVGYNSRQGQYKAIAAKCKTFDTSLEDSVIAYRNSSSSYLMSIYLHYAQVPFNISKGFGPYDYQLFNAIQSVMQYAKRPKSRREMMNLYKILPITKDEMYQALGYNYKTNEFDNSEPIAFSDLPFNQRKFNQSNFKRIYDLIVELPYLMNKKTSREYMPLVIDAIVQNYWAYRVSLMNLEDVINRVCMAHVYHTFDTNLLYLDVESSIISHRNRYSTSRTGVTLSTFHSLKGLEFTNVVLCDLAESIFPNFSAIDYRDYDDETKLSLKEAENRLMYVAITRSKANLFFYYDKQDPSYYISFLKEQSTTESRRAISYDDQIIDTPIDQPSQEEVVVKIDRSKEGEITSTNVMNYEPPEDIKVIKVSNDPETPSKVVESEVVENDTVEVYDLGAGIKTVVKSKVQNNLLNRVFK